MTTTSIDPPVYATVDVIREPKAYDGMPKKDECRLPSYSERAITKPVEARKLIRNRLMTKSTTGWCEGYIQANLLVLPAKYRDDFVNLCVRNPVPCPLLGETEIGKPTEFKPEALAKQSNVATDIPFYCEYINGKFSRELENISKEWTEDYVGFLIGCSFSFEAALVAENFIPRHLPTGDAPPMFITNIPLCASGVFTGTFVVSMRPYPEKDLERIRKITSAYTNCHGEPVAWGWDGAKKIGVKDCGKPDFGVPVEFKEGEIPIFWGCGVTPQNVVMMSKLPEPVYSHKPGDRKSVV